ncbi:hypothetical protein MTP99_012834 [Tenebrio molitor]|nr:hypothetical protein MTP99_012834 [Tenebrio molitor]
MRALHRRHLGHNVPFTLAKITNICATYLPMNVIQSGGDKDDDELFVEDTAEFSYSIHSVNERKPPIKHTAPSILKHLVTLSHRTPAQSNQNWNCSGFGSPFPPRPKKGTRG